MKNVFEQKTGFGTTPFPSLPEISYTIFEHSIVSVAEYGTENLSD